MKDVSLSFLQDTRHEDKSRLFEPIQPLQIAEMLDARGFDMVHLKTGKARKEGKENFQTTIARYRSRDDFSIEGLSFDIILKIPHLYGALFGVLGLFRGVCSNQLNVGTHFETIRVAHKGNPMEYLEQAIPALVAQREKLVETVRLMQATTIEPYQLDEMADLMGQARLKDVPNVNDFNSSLLTLRRRDADAKSDLFTALNVIQENLMYGRLEYATRTLSNDGSRFTVSDIKLARSVRNGSAQALALNAQVWDIATNYIKAA